MKYKVLKDICEIVNGYAFKSKDFTDAGIPVIKIKNVKPNKIILDGLTYVPKEIAEKRSDYLIKVNDILLTMTGNRADGSPDSWVGKSAIFKDGGRYLLNQRVAIIRPKSDEVDVEYLSYYLSSWATQLYFIKRANSSGGQANISPAIVGEYEIPIPELGIQKKIAGILSVLDEKIRINDKINENLEHQIETILLKTIDNANTQPVKLGDYLYIKGRIGWKGLKKSEYLPVSDYRIINGESLTLSGIDWNKAGYISAERYEESPEIMLNIGDILLSKDGTIGKIGYVDKLETPTSVASGIFVIRNTRQAEISTQFIYYLLKSRLFKAFITSRTEGSVIPHLYQKDFTEFEFQLPSPDDMKTFDDTTAAMFSMVFSNLNENERLIHLRDSLLPKLMSGELDISGIEI